MKGYGILYVKLAVGKRKGESWNETGDFILKEFHMKCFQFGKKPKSGKGCGYHRDRIN